MQITMTVEVTDAQRHTIERLERLIEETPLFHGYARGGNEREYDQEDAVWLTFGGIYILVQTNGDTERDVLIDFLDLDERTITENLLPGSHGGMVRG